MSAENNRVERASRDDAIEAGPSNAGSGRLADRIDHERIAARAYQIYESQHRADGHADDHWRQAEVEYADRRAHELAELRTFREYGGRR
jgi:Protein of unknown function (DUF2934)